MKPLCLALACLTLGASATVAKPAAPVVLGARIGEHSDHTRFVL